MSVGERAGGARNARVPRLAAARMRGVLLRDGAFTALPDRQGPALPSFGTGGAAQQLYRTRWGHSLISRTSTDPTMSEKLLELETSWRTASHFGLVLSVY